MFGIYAIDPGGTTGICYAEWTRLNDSLTKEPDHLLKYNFPIGEHHEQLFDDILDKRARGYSSGEGQGFVIVCEDFTYRPHIDNVVLQPVQYIGVVHLISQKYGIPLKMQLPATKSWWDDNKLKRAGLYKRGEKHQNDATRHFAYYLMNGVGNMCYVNYLKPSKRP